MNLRSHVQIQQDVSPHESDYQPREVDTQAITHKQGVLDKRVFQPEQRARLPNFFVNRDSTEGAESSEQAAWCWCKQRARLPSSDRIRDSIGDAEGSHHSTEQLEKRARMLHFRADRYNVDTAEGSITRAVHLLSTQRSPQQHRRHT